MKSINILLIELAVLAVLFSCKPTIDEFTPDKGTADFTKYIAVGDSWSAGFADASLYKSGQENSFPAILAKQFAEAGGGEFRQPLMLDDIGVGLGTGTPQPKMELAFRLDCKLATILAPGYIDTAVNMANLAPLGDPNPFNNISIPALKSFHIAVPYYGSMNPYYGRFATADTSQVIEEIPRVNASFFTLTLGMYDALSYALYGGEGDPPTSDAYFAGSIQAALQTLTANGAKGAVANVPDVISAPFFHAIPYNGLVLTEQIQVDGLNAGYVQLNQIIKASGSTDTLHFVLGANAFVIQADDPQHPWGRRQIKADELILMSCPQDSLKCGGWGSQDPIPVFYVLDAEEIVVLNTAVDSYNSMISQASSSLDVALVDLNAITKELNTGIIFDAVTLNSKMVTGNFYSLDGLNPTPMGSAMVAYYYIDAINKTFNAKIPQVIVPDYPAVKIP
jgi:hypothetical protein